MKRIAFGLEGGKKKCPTCGVERGEKHRDKCDIEECPICGGRFVTCGHHPDNFSDPRYLGKGKSILGNVGLCPKCFDPDHIINIYEVLPLTVDRAHFAFCPEHKTYWYITYVGNQNVCPEFTRWLEEEGCDETTWAKNKIFLETCEEVKPVYPKKLQSPMDDCGGDEPF